ncbi:Splicing factor [Thoreauomyces humboldtii]|nr:Splicing factor [Thoreauomyces humboldtii]
MDAAQRLSEVEALAAAADTQELKQAAIEAYQSAIADVWSPTLWAAYLRFLFDQYVSQLAVPDSDPEDDDDAEENVWETLRDETSKDWLSLQAVRSAAESGLTATELHFTESAKIWGSYRDFETGFCQALKTDEQKNRVREMYLKRLKTSHAQLSETFSDYSTFETTYGVPSEYEKRLKAANAIVAATEKANAKRSHQEDLLVAGNHTLEAYQSFLAFEKAGRSADPFQIRTLYERALLLYPLDAGLWDAYIVDVMNLCPVEPVVKPILHRALLNCSWSADIWCHQFRVLERFGTNALDFQVHYVRALAALSVYKNVEEVVKLMQGRQQYLLHQIDWKLNAGSDYLNETQGMTRQSLLSSKHARRISKVAKKTTKLEDLEAARTLYEQVCKAFGSQGEIWIEYAEFERLHGTIEQARSVYKRACNKTKDWPERVFEMWISMEKEEGSIENFYAAAAAVRKQAAVVEKMRLKDASANGIYNQATVDGNFEATAGAQASVTTDMDIDVPQEVPYVAPTSSGEAVTSMSPKKRQREKGTDEDAPQKRQKGEKQTPETSVPEKSEKPLYEYHIIDNKTAGLMVYVTNLSARVDQADVRKAFESCGRIVDLYVQPNSETGALEAYVEFTDATQVRKAAALDGTVIADQPVKVLRCKPEEGAWEFKETEEKNKIYVSHLPVKIEKSTLREIFAKFGHLVEIRLVVKDTTAFAYIEYSTADSATRSLEADGKEVNGLPIRVAISNPGLKSVPRVDPCKLYVSNVPHTVQREDLEVLFTQFGKVQQVILLTREDGKPKGCAFIIFEDKESVTKALTLNGTMYEGRTLGVTLPLAEASSSSRGRGGHGGRGGRGFHPHRGGGAFRGRGGYGATQSNVIPRNANAAPKSKMAPTALIPGALLKKKPSKAPHKILAATSGAAHAPSAPAPASTTGLNQDDFRKMMFGKK